MLKFSCDRQTFATAISHVAKGVSQKSTIPELECLKLRLDHELLELTGYDLEFGIQCSIEVESEDKGEFAISPHLLNGAVSKCTGNQIVMEVADNYIVHLYCGDTKLQISAMSAAEYPSLPDLNIKEGIKIEQGVLNSMIRRTKYAASTNEAKPVLTGELFEIENQEFHVAAIDGFRLAVRKEPISSEEDRKFVVPKQTLEKVSAMLQDDAEDLCVISADRRNVVFEFGGYVVFSRLLEGEFHHYKSSIPDRYDTEVEISVRDLQQCLERCGLLISGKFNAPVRCTFGDDMLKIWCKTGIGEIDDRIPAKVIGPEVTIGFDNQFFLDAVRNSDCDVIKIQLTGGNRVAKIIPPEGEHFIFLLMPVQLRK